MGRSKEMDKITDELVRKAWQQVKEKRKAEIESMRDAILKKFRKIQETKLTIDDVCTLHEGKRVNILIVNGRIFALQHKIKPNSYFYPTTDLIDVVEMFVKVENDE